MHCKAAVTVSLECVSFNGRPSSGTLKHWLMHFSPGVITMYRWPIFALLVLISFDLCVLRKQKKPPQTLSRGWGDDITWVQTYEEGLAKMQDSHKPLMVIHHTEECQHSQALKKAFAEHKDIQTMAQNDFIMLNVMHETIDQNLSPDGHYVPRILFVDPSFTVRADIAGKYSNHLYTYQPEDIDLLADNMRKAKTLVHPHPDL